MGPAKNIVMSRNEANTRKKFIDRALQTAGWNLEDPNQVGIEIPVDGYDAEPWNGVTDYCLYQPNGEAIAVVEAKRQSRDPRVAEQQVRHFLRAGKNVFMKKRRLEVADLYEEPLERFGDDAVERWVTEEQVEELMELTEQFAV
jgi:type I site-specific restriction endonuclease